MRFSLPVRLRYSSAPGTFWTDSRQRYLFEKRLLDIALCLVSLPLLIVIAPIIAVGILLDSPGPIFFVQERVGLGGRLFRMYKFRTFRCDYDDQHDREFMKDFVKGHISQSSDSKSLCKPITKQITRLGQILRKASLDEIPQLINVWRGEMSIIGPRPNVPWEVEAYEDWHRERLDALPGITGLAQVRGRSSISFDSIVHYDIEYIKKQSLKLDFKILWWTVSWVVSGKGAG